MFKIKHAPFILVGIVVLLQVVDCQQDEISGISYAYAYFLKYCKLVSWLFNCLID